MQPRPSYGRVGGISGHAGRPPATGRVGTPSRSAAGPVARDTGRVDCGEGEAAGDWGRR